MPTPPDYDALERSVRRATGAAAFDLWRAQFPAPTTSSVPDDLHELLTEQGLSPLLTAAAILESFADPALERSISMKDRGSLDTRGTVKAWLEKAASLRRQVSASGGGRILAGARIGGVGIPAFTRNDPLQGTTPDDFTPPGNGRYRP
jgi:hypothetical protein